MRRMWQWRGSLGIDLFLPAQCSPIWLWTQTTQAFVCLLVIAWGLACWMCLYVKKVRQCFTVLNIAKWSLICCFLSYISSDSFLSPMVWFVWTGENKEIVFQLCLKQNNSTNELWKFLFAAKTWSDRVVSVCTKFQLTAPFVRRVSSPPPTHTHKRSNAC